MIAVKQHSMYKIIQLYAPVETVSRLHKNGIKTYIKFSKRLFCRKAKLWRKWTSSRNVLDKHIYDCYTAKCKKCIKKTLFKHSMQNVNKT